MEEFKKGRGAQSNPGNSFLRNSYEIRDDFKEYCELENENIESERTEYLEIFPKTIISHFDSPDIGYYHSINPYQGCEHGCVYCYARNTHEYFGYSAGKDFERKILVKKSAPELLEKELRKKSWKPELIMLSGNTDPYQPIERKLKITRSILKVLESHKNPVGIITKNALVKRDLDILKALNEHDLLRLTLSITSLKESTRRKMEPRTASVKQRLDTLELMAKNGIKVNVNMAPIIPGINSDEIFQLAEEISKRGAHSISYIMVRLNGQIAGIFEDWVNKVFPMKSEKILNQIRETHQGKLNDSRWSKRMKGDGKIAEHIASIFKIVRQKYFNNEPLNPLNAELFHQSPADQLRLF
ncbi:MAG: PA0069 family radical SAM protein [Flavobacteriales bacterium]|nr:PA0069 family radical SAM protein [Flavobacteriales bacterium]